MTVVREDRIITIGEERGMRGKNGVSSLVACAVVRSDTYWTMTPSQPVEALGVDQVFFGIAPEQPSNSTLVVKIIGVNDAEERTVYLADGTTQVTPDQVPEGASFAIRYNTVSGVMQLIWPSIAASAGQAVIRCDITGTPNALIFTPRSGYTVDINGRQVYGGYASAANTAAISADVIGLTNGDIRQVLLPGGTDQVPAGLISGPGVYVEIAYLAGGLFELVHPVSTDAGSGGLTTYQQIEGRRTADNAAKAATLARRALI